VKAAGFGGLLAQAPDLTPQARRAAHCWHWCGGWRPDLWPAYTALHEVDDWQLITELMKVIRDHG